MFQIIGVFDGSTDLRGWLVSEKFDGHRAMWTGDRFVSRSGLVLAVPAWFCAGLPSVALDGEIYCGSTHDEVQSIVRSGIDDPRWATMTFRVFDAPTVAGGKARRVAAVPALVADAPFAFAVEHTAIRDAAQAIDMMRLVVAVGGEGVVAVAPSSRYTVGRARDAMKIKPGEGGEIKHAARRVRGPWWERQVRS